MRIRFKQLSRYQAQCYIPGATENVDDVYAARVVSAGLAEYAPEPWEDQQVDQAAELKAKKEAADRKQREKDTKAAKAAAELKEKEARKEREKELKAEKSRKERKESAWSRLKGTNKK